MAFRTNRRKGGIFKAGRPLPLPVGKIIPNAPEIVSFEDAGSVPVEDGSGQRYIVRYADSHSAEVEFTDAFDPESSEESEGEAEWAEDVEEREPRMMYSIRVVWDGAVDFHESYDANDEDDRNGIMKDLIARYGKIAEDFTGISAVELDDKIKQRVDEKDEGEGAIL